MRLHEVLLSWDLDDLDDFVEAKPRRLVDLIFMMRWAARVAQLVLLAVQHRANSSGFLKSSKGNKMSCLGGFRFIYTVSDLYFDAFLFC